ncbi:BTAD domain-containing putative transcriptional regulator [Crossiella sp. CA-258035]|uniref:AfsR/SARP family transcriptional regulator n=1 Tax=Crossiella sp. CA-258035 TaxID=2981138 RepID=UPI0024BD478B|nr:BTAD domain-containing putative transcriptional regulator [Crossiella sp. CA-258035]WHT16641.1 BTAD domain-containing putative transcriptional regulator [Crossiella sp. CA-258035]
MPVRFRLLGEFQVLDGDAVLEIRHQRQRCVLAALLVDLNQVVRLDTLADRVWGEQQPGRPRDTLYSYVSRLRSALAGVDGVTITQRAGGYLLTADPGSVDLHRFQDLVARVSAAHEEQRAALLTRALDQWTGVALADIDGAWAAQVRETLTRQRFDARLDLAELELHSGQSGGLDLELAGLTAAHPLDERLASLLVLARYRNGRQDAALREYERIRLLLAAELGADPGPALRRLHQQIRHGDTAPAPPRARPHPAPRQLPAAPQHFTGRTQELAVLDDGSPQSTVVISAIGGAGGIGKTSLALHWAHRNAHRFPDGQLYVDLRGFDPSAEPMPAATAIRRFLDALGVAPAVVPAEPDAMATLYRSVIADKRLLIVLDNAADTAQVLPLLPGEPTCAVLVTSRRRLIGLTSAHGAVQVGLTVLADHEARELLGRRLGEQRLAAEPEAVAGILRSCSGLPLALGIVAARAVAAPAMPLSALAEELGSAAARLDAFDTDDAGHNLRAVFSWSYRALPAEAGQVFALLGLAPGADLSLTAIGCLTGLPAARLRGPLRALESSSLVERTLPDRYRMHDLLRLYATELAERLDEATREAALRRLVEMYLVVAGRARELVMFSPRIHEVVDTAAGDPSWPVFGGSAEALDWLEAERANLLALVARLAERGRPNEVWRLAWLLHGFFRARQHKADWIEVGRLGVAAAARIGDPVASFHAANCLGGAYRAAGRWAEAIAQYRDALSQAASDPERTAMMVNNIGITLVNSGDAEAALGCLEQALALARQAGSANDEAVYSLNLGDGYNAVGRYPEGLRHNETARTLFRSLGKDLHGAIAAVNIAQSCLGLGELAKAAASAEEAGAEFRALSAWFDLAKSLHLLGRIRNALGHHDSARGAWTDALETFRELNDPRATEVEQLLRGLD